MKCDLEVRGAGGAKGEPTCCHQASSGQIVLFDVLGRASNSSTMVEGNAGPKTVISLFRTRWRPRMTNVPSGLTFAALGVQVILSLSPVNVNGH